MSNCADPAQRERERERDKRLLGRTSQRVSVIMFTRIAAGGEQLTLKKSPPTTGYRVQFGIYLCQTV